MVFCTKPGHEPLIAFPLLLLMGWKNSPSIFCTATGTIADLTNQCAQAGMIPEANLLDEEAEVVIHMDPLHIGQPVNHNKKILKLSPTAPALQFPKESRNWFQLLSKEDNSSEAPSLLVHSRSESKPSLPSSCPTTGISKTSSASVCPTVFPGHQVLCPALASVIVDCGPATRHRTR